jgi:hypothetical protein
MFKSLLIRWITELNNAMVSVGSGTSGLLAVTINAFNATLYGYVIAIMTSVIMPIAYTILALFFVLELYKASVKVEGAGGGTSLGAEIVFRVLFRMVICKWAVDSSLLIMTAIYDVGYTAIHGVAGVLTSSGITTAIDVAALTAAINAMSLGEQIGMFIELVIVKFAVWVILGLVRIICIARFIEIYVFVAISPIPIATFPSDDLNAIAKNFLKSFAAVALQGVFIYIVLSFFPMLFTTNILGDTSIFGMLLYSLILALGVFGSSRWAKSICNAM